MDIYGLIYIHELLKSYSLLLGIKFTSISIETYTDHGTKFNVIQWNEFDAYIEKLFDGYNSQYRRIVADYIIEQKGALNERAKELISKCAPFNIGDAFFNLWLGEVGTAAERAVVQPVPFMHVNHVVRLTGCVATMKSSVDDYEYNITLYADRLSKKEDTREAEKTEYKYIVSRIVNEKITTLRYNQLAKDECPQELKAICKKANKMLDTLRQTKSHESVSGISVYDFMKDLVKYTSKDSPYVKYWNQVHEPFNMSRRDGVKKIDPKIDGDEIINIAY